MKRLFCALAFGLLCVPASASAAVRYAEPVADGANPCTQADPCPLRRAVDDAVDGDSVVLLPGSYTESGPLIIDAAIDIHGPAAGVRPTVNAGGKTVFVLGHAGAQLRDMTINSGNDPGVILVAGLMDRLYVHATGLTADACRPESVGAEQLTITNSVCRGSGADAKGIGGVWGSNNFHLTLRNVTAVGGVDGIKLAGTVTVMGTNVIASGGSTDTSANGQTHMTFSYSNYGDESAINGATITDPGTGTNQTAQPVFVNAALGDFHQAANSPTVDAGENDPANGPFDLDGDARTQGFATDIGADELDLDSPPTAVDDAATLAQDAAATVISVLANDTDPDGGLKALESATQPAHGTVVPSPMGVTYQPAAGYCGPDSFTYMLNGGSTASVSVTVTCLQRPDATAPDTRFVKRPMRRTRNRLAKFRFSSTEPGSTFRCKLDGRVWRSCGRIYQVRVKPGRHVMKVRATDRAGNRDRTPSAYQWRVLRPRR